jgi:RNA-binding protein YhbY
VSDSPLINKDSVLKQLQAALAQNKLLKSKIAKLERENAKLKRDIDRIYDAQNG